MSGESEDEQFAMSASTETALMAFENKIAGQKRLIDELHKQLSIAFRERDTFQKVSEERGETLSLYSRTSSFLPSSGLVCDGEMCPSAIGIVGIRVADPDAMASPLSAIALACQWSVIEDESKPRHYCPRCTKDRRAKGETP